jgi:hypothetical protein
VAQRQDNCPGCTGLKDKRAKFCRDCFPRRATSADHGDVRRYWAGCRCASCKQANAAYAGERKLKSPELVRGEQSRYQLRNRDRINSKRRASGSVARATAAATVKRRLRAAGAILDYYTETEKNLVSDYLVYALVDPRDLAVRYVGVSSSGLGRPKCHSLPSVLAQNYNKRKDDWIRDLQSAGLSYAVRVLEFFETSADAHRAEPYWVQWMRDMGEHIYNLTAGDDTQITMSEETKQKIREAMTGRVITWGAKISEAKLRASCK